MRIQRFRRPLRLRGSRGAARALTVLLGLLCAFPARGQTIPENAWSFSASLYGYLLPEGPDYLQPTVTADRGWLHLEARANYEALNTGSVWMGYTVGGGKKLVWDLTPMIAGVFGGIDGVAPGYRGSLTWGKLGLYSEGEYVIHPADSSENFFYNWSEATVSPVAWFRVGLVTQRTRAYQSDRDIQRGLLIGVERNAWELTGHVFNPDESRPTVVIALRVNF